ncbi:MAG: DapH/DapD/GlmU-related protein [Oscillospiraceae bacterium]
MNQMRAVFFLSEDNDSKPLMLETIQFCPILTWIGEKMSADGVGRFFVFVGATYADEARACFSPDADVIVSERQEDLLQFLGEDGAVVVFPRAALPIPAVGDEANDTYTADAAALRAGAAPWTNVSGGTALPGYVTVSDRKQLQAMQLRCRDAIVAGHSARGVVLLDPGAVYIDPRATIGAGTVLLPGTLLRGKTAIGKDCEIGPNSVVRDCTVGDSSTVNASQINESTVGSHTKIGPFAYVRPGSTIGDDIKVGDFVEVKNSVIGNGTKISHLTYVGDSDIGERVNFGCGTVTTNYDGFHKYRTVVGNDVFIGCNTNLVAPVSVGDGAYIAAGGTITKDVPADSLAIARVQATIKDDWAAKRRRLHGKK